MKAGLITEHRLWIVRQRKKHPSLPTGEALIIEGELGCGNCGCLGNRECKHDCLDEDNNCTLIGDDTCPCCMIEPEPLSDAQYDSIVGQAQLIEKNI